MSEPLPVYPTVHLAIAVQEEFLESLSARRRNILPRAIRNFANDIAPEIPTIWVFFNSCGSFALYGDSLSSQPARELVLWRNHGIKLPFASVNRNEYILIKNSLGSIDKVLTDHLEGLGATALVLTGCFSKGCVFQTAWDALEANYHCTVITNLLADSNHAIDNRNSYKWRGSEIRGEMKKEIPDQIDNLHLRTSYQFLRSINKKPAPPVKAAPVSKLLTAEA
jgi:nicotinamidase-related amidase